MMNSIFIFLGMMAFGHATWALNYSSEIFEPKTSFQKKLFDLSVTSATSPDGVVTATGTFKNTQTGEVVIEEVAKYKDAEFMETKIEQKQTGEKGQIKVADGKIEFIYISKDGKEKKNSEKIKSGMKILAPANFIVFIRKNWAELNKDKVIPLRMVVWDRYETVGFDLIYEGPVRRSGQDLIKLKLKPSSFLIAALVNPISMWFSTDGQRMIEMQGRVAPKVKDGDDWKTLDADVKYAY
ncbi:MAG: hypothetical protein ACK5P5_05935 [Pseudobdellovibrionaceae bacterium]